MIATQHLEPKAMTKSAKKIVGITLAAFAQTMGVDRSQVTRWAAKGLPVLPAGVVDPGAAADWVRANVQDYARRRSVGAQQAIAAEDRRRERNLATLLKVGDETAANIAAAVLLPVLPEAKVREVVGEIHRRLRLETADYLSDEVGPPAGYGSWTDFPGFMAASPVEVEWQDLIAAAQAGQRPGQVPK